jgi:CheY-like chemotaxis protein
METLNSCKVPYKLVLIVDDSSIDNFVNQKMIELNNFAEKVVAFTRAKKALEYLIELDKSNAHLFEIPSFIFLDLNMPIMDGHEFIKQFKNLSDEIKNNCKIIILTSSVNPIDPIIANEHNYVLTFLSKPLMKNNFDLIELLINDKSSERFGVSAKAI